MSKTIEIKPETLYKILGCSEGNVDGFEMIEDKIISSDVEDGGAEHEYVIKEEATGNFYKGYYSDWDIDNTDYDDENDEIGDRCDLSTELDQVFPKEITITVYE